MTQIPRPPAHVAPYVEVLGLDLAVAFLLAFGGGDLSLHGNPTPRSRLVQFVGLDRARALAGRDLPRRVPLAKPWVAQVLRAKGLPAEEIARRMHASNVAVRGWLASAAAEAAAEAADARQPRLL